MWKIPPRHSRCCSCKRPFTGGSSYFSSLHDEPCQRLDHCETCWHSQPRDAADMLVSWQGVILQKKGDDKQHPLHKAIELLRTLLDGSSPADAPLAYLLALWLERRKGLLLKKEASRHSGAVLLYEVATTEELLAIPKTTLRDSDALRLNDLLAAMDDRHEKGISPLPPAPGQPTPLMETVCA